MESNRALMIDGQTIFPGDNAPIPSPPAPCFHPTNIFKRTPSFPPLVKTRTKKPHPLVPLAKGHTWSPSPLFFFFPPESRRKPPSPNTHPRFWNLFRSSRQPACPPWPWRPPPRSLASTAVRGPTHRLRTNGTYRIPLIGSGKRSGANCATTLAN